MAVFLEGIVEAAKNIAAFCKELVGVADAEKYANGVQALGEDLENTFSMMKEVIMNDDTLTADEKLEKLEKIANRQERAQENRQKALDGNRNSVLKLLREITLALLTCGVSCLPVIFKDNDKDNEGEKELIEGGYEVID